MVSLSSCWSTPVLQSRVARVTGVRNPPGGETGHRHYGEKDALFTTAGRKSIGFSFQVCNVRFPNVSVYRLTQTGFKLEVNDMTAQLKLPGSGALDLDLIGGTPWLGPWTVRSRRKHEKTAPFLTDNRQARVREWFPEEGGEWGMVITGSWAGAGTAGKLRREPIPWTVDEAVAEQDAVQTRVPQRNRS